MPSVCWCRALRIEWFERRRCHRRRQAAKLSQTKHEVQQIGKQFSITSTSEHALLQAMLAGLIHTFQAILSSIPSRYPIATAVQP
jgi:hypothetical protein